MNTSDPLETLLRGFVPRTPSPKLRERLFGTAPCASRPGLLQVWFAPLAATAVVILSLGTAWSPAGNGGVAGTAFAAIPATWESSGIERNALPRPTFSTSSTGATMAAVPSGFGALLLRQTNVLAR